MELEASSEVVVALTPLLLMHRLRRYQITSVGLYSDLSIESYACIGIFQH